MDLLELIARGLLWLLAGLFGLLGIVLIGGALLGLIGVDESELEK